MRADDLVDEAPAFFKQWIKVLQDCISLVEPSDFHRGRRCLNVRLQIVVDEGRLRAKYIDFHGIAVRDRFGVVDIADKRSRSLNTFNFIPQEDFLVI